MGPRADEGIVLKLEDDWCVDGRHQIVMRPREIAERFVREVSRRA